MIKNLEKIVSVVESFHPNALYKIYCSDDLLKIYAYLPKQLKDKNPYIGEIKL